VTMAGARSAAAGVAAALVAAGCAGQPLVDPGPLSNTVAHGWETTMPVGSVFTDGLEVLHLDGHQPAVINSVTMVGDKGIQLVGASLATPERDFGAFQQLKDYPPTNRRLGDLIPAEGASITPFAQDKIGWELLLGIKVVDDGYHVRDGIIIEYTVAGHDYRVFDPAQLVVCTSEEFYGGHRRCPFPWQIGQSEPAPNGLDTPPTTVTIPPPAELTRRRSRLRPAATGSTERRSRRVGGATAHQRRTRRRRDPRWLPQPPCDQLG
jgi:hypothetical protein